MYKPVVVTIPVCRWPCGHSVLYYDLGSCTRCALEGAFAKMPDPLFESFLRLQLEGAVTEMWAK